MAGIIENWAKKLVFELGKLVMKTNFQKWTSQRIVTRWIFKKIPVARLPLAAKFV